MQLRCKPKHEEYMNDFTDLINNSVEFYLNTFNGYFGNFLHWGQDLFYGLAIIFIVWLCLWLAFAGNFLEQTMVIFLQEFFVVAFFYTLMMNAMPWLSSILKSAIVMGTSLSHHEVDPASIIEQGIALANKMLLPFKDTGVLQHLFGALLMLIAYVLVLLAFFAVALDLAVTLIVTTFLVVLASFSLAFAALRITRKIAYHTLDAIIANSMKLVTLYIVIGLSGGILLNLANNLPTDKVTTFDLDYWIVAVSLLFWLIAKNLGQQVKLIFTGAIG